MNGEHKKPREALSEDRRFYGAMGLARMALRLAEQRAVAKFPQQNLDGFCDLGLDPSDRSEVEGEPEHMWPLSSEYYRIIDRIARGEKP